MTIISSDGLRLLIGDGATTEAFNALKGANVKTWELNQRSHASDVVGEAWVTNIGTSRRQLMLDCDAYANDEAAALRLRSLALSGMAGNVKLEIASGERIQFSAFVMRYREVITAGDIKRIECRLESTGGYSLG